MSELATILGVGILIGVVLFIVISNIVFHFKSLNSATGMTLGPVKDKDLCKQPHSWMKVYLMGVGRDGNVNMCRICGYIAGSKYMASQEMIDRLESLERKQKVEEELYQEFIQTENNEITAWFDAEVKNGVDLNKLMDLHVAGQTFQQRFAAFVDARSKGELSKKDM